MNEVLIEPNIYKIINTAGTVRVETNTLILPFHLVFDSTDVYCPL